MGEDGTPGDACRLTGDLGCSRRVASMRNSATQAASKATGRQPWKRAKTARRAIVPSTLCCRVRARSDSAGSHPCLSSASHSTLSALPHCASAANKIGRRILKKTVCDTRQAEVIIPGPEKRSLHRHVLRPLRANQSAGRPFATERRVFFVRFSRTERLEDRADDGARRRVRAIGPDE